MDRGETAKILAVLKANYPNTYKDMKREEAENILNLWTELLSDLSYEDVGYAVKYFIANDTKGFPPVIGNIREIIAKAKKQQDLTEGEAWGMVYKAICNSAYNSIEEFNKLPQDIKRAVGSADVLKSWAMLDINEVSTVIQSNFMRSFKVAHKQEKEFEALPESIKSFSQQLASKFEMKMLN